MDKRRKPEWIRIRPPSGKNWQHVDAVLRRHRLHTVCDEARCPNKGECWGCGTATFMIMGDVCTRACRFCAVQSGQEGNPLRPEEGAELAAAAAELGLKYVVLTSVDRDDLPDKGAGHFASCVAALKTSIPGIRVETLIPDYGKPELAALIQAGPDVVAHNVESVRSLQHIRDRRASFDKSLETLALAKACGPVLTKSSILLGLGEKTEEVLSAMDELRSVHVDMLVLGQYLQPSKKQLPVSEYISPEQFERYAAEGLKRGFRSVVASPFARTSYHALESSRALENGN